MDYVTEYTLKNHQREMRAAAENERRAMEFRKANAHNRQNAVRQMVGRALVKLGESLQAADSTAVPSPRRREV